MANNVFVSYDLYSNKDYTRLITAIKAISPQWAKIQLSLWYVKTTLTAAEVRDRLMSSVDGDDSLFVIDATNSQAAWNGNISDEVAKYLLDNWNA